MVVDFLLVRETAGMDKNSPTAPERVWGLPRWAKGGHVKEIKLLLAAGADSNVCDEDLSTGKTCQYPSTLHGAAREGQVVILREFVRHGGDRTNATDSLGWNALHIAAREDVPEAVECLVEQTSRAKGLVEAGTLEKSSTPPMVASACGNAKALLALLAEPRVKNSNGDSALHLASYPCSSGVERSHVQVVDLLVRWGAYENAKNDQ